MLVLAFSLFSLLLAVNAVAQENQQPALATGQQISTESCALKVNAQLVDKNLNVKAVPKLKLIVREVSSTRNQNISTGFDGNVQMNLPCGTYSLASESPLDFEGRQFRWDLKVTLTAGAPVPTLELSNDNAQIKAAALSEQPSQQSVPSGRVQDSLAGLFKKYENSVVTVWSEVGHGTGFFVDDNGLVVTNQHVIGPSEYIAIQMDADHKIPAALLAADADKDVAVLWADKSLLPGAIIAPMAKPAAEEPLAVEGERVLTIGSPLNQRKILTTGIVSKLEARAIISDININPGNSGGPFFNSLGFVIGITTFREGSGPGISGIVRIEQVEDVLASARTKMASASPPPSKMLPVEPKAAYPLDAIKAAVSDEHFDPRPYIFSEGDYDIAVITPVLKYNLQGRAEVEAAKEKSKRTRNTKTAVQGTFQPLSELRNWAEYAGEYQAVIQIRATPKLRETLGSAFLRGMTARNGVSTIPAKMRFKTDFYKMRLKCGDQEIEPIQPGKVAKVIDVKGPFVNATDATYEGLYTYPPDAISTSCGQVSLELYSEKNPASAKVHLLDKKIVERVWNDFDPYRSSNSKQN